MKWKLGVNSCVEEYPLKKEKKNSQIVIKNPLYNWNNTNPDCLTCVYLAWVKTILERASIVDNSIWHNWEYKDDYLLTYDLIDALNVLVLHKDKSISELPTLIIVWWAA